jgi:hypothetical protein
MTKPLIYKFDLGLGTPEYEALEGWNVQQFGKQRLKAPESRIFSLNEYFEQGSRETEFLARDSSDDLCLSAVRQSCAFN